LSLWLSPEPSRIPDYATHQIGVGAVVLNSNNELLVVREAGRNYARWKLPGGLSDVGESLGEAAEREVLEETGVRASFESVVAFRHSVNGQFGRGDIYFVSRLKPVEESQVPVPQAGEIEDARWLPLDEYARIIKEDGHPFMQHVVDRLREGGKIEAQWLPSIVPGRKPSPIYSVPTKH
jgi:ADP-ribose pyrophosphatase YjhB (NUDIX family)